MAEDNGKEEEKFDFTAEGEGYLSLDEARVLAMRTANEAPGDYGSQYQGVTMVFEVESLEETDDFYEVTLLFRPQGNFDGTPGQEQFVVGKEGSIAVRQVLISPVRKGGGFPILPVGIGVVVVGAIVAAGAVFVLMWSGGNSVPVAAVASTETPAPIEPQIPRQTSRAEVGNDIAQFLSQSHPKSCPECNLAGADLRQTSLKRADLTGADMTGADLSDADLSGAKLTKANLTGADLSDADLRYAHLSEANLTEANLTGADLFVANLRYAHLSEANLSEANLRYADLTRADLTRADLTRADLRQTSLNRADLTGADMTGADLSDADLSDADLDGVIGADFTDANNVPVPTNTRYPTYTPTPLE